MKDCGLSESKKLYVLLGAIILTAFFLRAWGNWFGLPHIYHTDEWKEVKRALQLGGGFFDFRRIGKGGYFYLLFLEYSAFFLLAKLAGVINSPDQFLYRFFFQDPTALWLIGRTTTAVIGSLNVYFVYRLGKRSHNSAVGTLAALFLAFAFLHAKHSHYITVDVPLTCLLSIAFYYIVRMLQTGALKDYLLSGLFAALAMMTKLSGVVIIVPLMVAHYYNLVKEKHSLLKMVAEKRILLCFLSLIMVYCLGEPGIVLGLRRFIGDTSGLFRLSATSQAGSQPLISAFPERIADPWGFYFSVLREGLGLPTLILSLAGLGYAAIKKEKADLVLLSFVVPFFLILIFFKKSGLLYGRYVLPLTPLLAIWAARFVWQGLSSWPLSKNSKNLILPMIVLGIVAEPGYRTIKNNYSMCKKDTRTLTKEWVENNIPAGAKILSDDFGILNTQSAIPLNMAPRNLRRIINEYEGKNMMSALKRKFYGLRMKSLQQRVSYDLVLAGIEPRVGTVPWGTLDDFIAQGVQYVIINAEYLSRILSGINREHLPFLAVFYKELKDDSKAVLLKRFDPGDWDATGPLIEIYQLRAGKV